MPVQFCAAVRQGVQQGIEQLAVVQLTLLRQPQTLVEFVRQRWLQRRQIGLLQGLRCRQFGHLQAGGLELVGKALGLAGVLAVPHNHRALALEKHRRG